MDKVLNTNLNKSPEKKPLNHERSNSVANFTNTKIKEKSEKFSQGPDNF